MTRAKRWWLALPVAAALALVAEVHWWNNAERHLHPPRVPITSADLERARRVLPFFEAVTFRTRDGLRLFGWFSKGLRADAIVLVHGVGSNRASLLDAAQALTQHGHGVLLYDSRANGESEGELATWGDSEQLDAQAALDYVSGRADVDPARLGLYGFSVGGTTAALVAARDSRVAATVLGPTWTSLDDEIRAEFGKWGPFSLWPARAAFRHEHVAVSRLRPIDVMASLARRPLFLMSGDEDTDTPPPVMRALHARVPGVEYWLVHGAGHGGFEQAEPVAFSARFCGFFDRAFPLRATASGSSSQ
jgi:pimeloyl-ACP methyl ester carboxylesterase